MPRRGDGQGEAGIGRRRRDVTFDQAAQEFLKWRSARTRCEKHKRARIEAGARVMANRELAVLSNPFNRCREWKLYEGENPVDRVKGVREPRGRTRYLEPGEEARLLAAAREPLRTIILAGIHAGLRVRSEPSP